MFDQLNMIFGLQLITITKIISFIFHFDGLRTNECAETCHLCRLVGNIAETISSCSYSDVFAMFAIGMK
jgi:hypothetical protein